ncbi:hypothetical protein [Billgrantia desiderata]|uniref:phage tail tube protein n=1 Tax=Billgrantia desiderata TaxID=52021 RepID=UPI001F2F9619|nr:hypothetical protein [Halomonas desiderata]MCE8012892.1 hypothetical protein [Halomonas desiderata]
MAIKEQNYTLGRGRLYFDDGSGERYIGNTPEFNLTTATETLEHYNSDEGLRNRDRNIVTQIDYSSTFTTDNISPENLAMLFMGEANTLTQAALTGEEDTFESVKPWNWYQLGTSVTSPAGKRDVSNVAVVKGGGSALTPGADYELDAKLGRIQVLEGGAIENGDTLTVTYDVAASTRSVVVSGAKQVQGKLRFISANPEGAGDQRDYFMPSVTLSANGDFALKAEQDWQAIPFSVEIAKTESAEAIYADGRPYTP